MNDCCLPPRPRAEGPAGAPSFALGPPAEFAAGPSVAGPELSGGAAGQQRGHGAAPRPSVLGAPLAYFLLLLLLSRRGTNPSSRLVVCSKSCRLRKGQRLLGPPGRRGSPPRPRARTCSRNGPAAPPADGEGGSEPPRPESKQRPAPPPVPALTQPRRVRVEGDARHRRSVASQRPDQDGVLLRERVRTVRLRGGRPPLPPPRSR